jgi:hypothetical protein
MKVRIHLGKEYQAKKYALLVHQKVLIEKHYDFLECNIKDNVLTCIGWLQLENCAESYRIKIEYVVGHEPKTTILRPSIIPSKAIHMYRDHSLCLHYPPDMPWNEKINICDYTIPWISEWIIFYEVYKITGKWEGPESPVHLREDDKNINVDVVEKT